MHSPSSMEASMGSSKIAIIIFSALLVSSSASEAKNKWAKPFSRGGPLSVQPKSVGELLPPCWGSPQDCRNRPGDTSQGPTQMPPQTQYYQAGLRVDCRDSYTGRQLGDELYVVSSPNSYAEARQLAWNGAFGYPDICSQSDSTRVRSGTYSWYY